jgi:ATP-binding cassette subfamily B protein
VLKLARFLKPYSLPLLAAIVLLFLQANCDLALPDYMSRIVNSLGAGEAGVRWDALLATGGTMLLLTLASAAATVIVGLIAARVAAAFARDLRSAVFAKVESFSQREFDEFSTASLITRTTNDVMQMQMVVLMLVRMVFYAPIIGIGAVLRALGKDSSMWWILALALLAVSLLASAIYLIAVPKFKAIQRLTDRLGLVSRERLGGIMVIRAFNSQAREEERFDGVNRELTSKLLFVSRAMATLMPLMMLAMNAVTLLIIWAGSRQVGLAAMGVGDMIAFMQYSMQIFFAFIMLSMMFIMLPRAAVSADRIAEVLGTELSISDPPERAQAAAGARAAGGSGTAVEFRQVRFSYPGAEEEVLRDVSFTAEAGQTTAIIGATGSGKSSLVGLLPRFYDASSGQVLVGGADVRELGLSELRSRIGYVPQRSTLFSGTIESNLRYADEDAPPEAVESAARIAQASEFIASMPEGMASPVSQGGANLSGGQRQRLAIARALLKRPPVYVFDDSFSALDFKTDAALRRALGKETAGATVLVVTQRVSSARQADRIVVLDEGKVVGCGTHAELMAGCEAYREIAVSQLSEEELR